MLALGVKALVNYLPLSADLEWRPGGDTLRLRLGAARRSHLAPEARGGDLEEPPTPKARAGGSGEQP